MHSRIAFVFAAALAASSASFVSLAYADPAPQSENGMRGFLTPQQRAMLMMENRGQFQNMSDDQRRAARQKMRDQWMAMSQADREKKRAELQAKYDALPQAQKDEINQHIAQWSQRHAEGGGQN